MELSTKIEAILFASSKPISMKRLAKLVGEKQAMVEVEVHKMKGEKNTEESGVHLLEHEGFVQLVTNPALTELVGSMTKEEFSGELTRPQLETLTIICYRGPVTKPEIEQIRGVNCSLILRNLMVRGLVREEEDSARLQPVYTPTADFLRHRGLTTIADLPDYETYHSDERITKLLEETFAEHQET